MFWYAVVGFAFIWLTGLSYFVFKTKSHYTRLTKRTRVGNIDEILDLVLEHDKEFGKEIQALRKEVNEMHTASRYFFQKIGLVRFNPFGRTSSDQSFVVALLDNENNGITINFIYTHEGIRVYTKKVRLGKGEEYELSEEETRAIHQAKGK